MEYNMAELNVNKLNSTIEMSPEGAIAEAERAFHKRVGEIADYIVGNKNIRVLLLAGPSGSGKTTSANLIKDALIARGEDSIVVSLDDFYRDSTDPDYPRQKNGERDFECPESLHLSEISELVRRISNAEPFRLPKYDFKLGRRVELSEPMSMPNGCVIIEGLHALNPKIYDGPRVGVLRLFVSVSTNINMDGKRILSGRKVRFLRRLVRDSIYRASSAERTLSMWRAVLDSEDIYLYPFKPFADIAFDTFHMFELGVMKPFAESLLTAEVCRENEYARRVRAALEYITEVDESLVPDNSLIREFIPGGIYEDLY